MGLFRLRYSCHLCGAEDVSVDVEERRPEANVGDWMKLVVAQAVAVDHAARSPGCPSDKVDIKLPIPPGTTSVGENVKS